MSLSPSASSIYDNRHENGDQHNQIAQAVQERDDRHGDGSRSARSVEAVHADGEDLEAKRQELIRELCQTEEIFVKRLHVFVRFFVLPLRVQNSKTWISGVPSEVARLFDWFEDIMNLHTQMLSLLQATRTAQYPIVERVAESIRAFIARFEVYQPYLVRVADVVSLMERLVQDETSDFGEFVDIQQSAPECDDWSFQMFLNEPLGRLAKYPDFFSVSVFFSHLSPYYHVSLQRLLRLTPKTHPDYLSTFSLVHSMDLIIHVLNEVNVREKEYDLIKSISVRIQELPPSVQLATRERRLLFRGLLHLVNTDEAVNKSKIALTTSAICSENSKGRSTNLANLSSKLAIEINEWDTRRARSESTSSSSTGTSFNSLGTSSGACSDMPAAPCSTFFSSYRIPIPDGRLNSTTNKTPASPSPNPRRSSTPRGTPVQVLIFTDLMVLTAPTSSLAPATTGDWTLLKNIGITRILGVPERLEQEPYGSYHLLFPPAASDPLHCRPAYCVRRSPRRCQQIKPRCQHGQRLINCPSFCRSRRAGSNTLGEGTSTCYKGRCTTRLDLSIPTMLSIYFTLHFSAPASEIRPSPGPGNRHPSDCVLAPCLWSSITQKPVDPRRRCSTRGSE